MAPYTRNTQTVPDDTPGGSSVRQAVKDQNSEAIDDLYVDLNAHSNNEAGRSHATIDTDLDAVDTVVAEVEAVKVECEDLRDECEVSEANAAQSATNAANCNQAAFDNKELAEGFAGDASDSADEAAASAASIVPDEIVKQTAPTGALILPSGTTAQRPATPLVTHERYNTTLGYKEAWNGSAWIKTIGKADVLTLDNTTSFTPDADYEPATKKYVDDNSSTGGSITELWTGSAGNGTNIDWTSTGDELSDFDTVLLTALGGSAYVNVEGVFSTLVPVADALSETILLCSITASGAGGSYLIIKAENIDDTSLDVYVLNSAFAGTLTGVYGINY